MNLESATLVLRSINANTNVGNYNNDLTWNDINIKALLGPMWMKYKRFKLIMTGFASSGQTGISDVNRIVNIYMEGLRWVQSSFDTSISANRSRALVGTAEFSTTGRTINYVNESGFIFDTQQTTSNIRLFFTRVTDDTLQATQYSPSIAIFSIYGIDE
jgi:hypothetical protein